jgi:hypothetical protein
VEAISDHILNEKWAWPEAIVKSRGNAEKNCESAEWDVWWDVMVIPALLACSAKMHKDVESKKATISEESWFAWFDIWNALLKVGKDHQGANASMKLMAKVFEWLEKDIIQGRIAKEKNELMDTHLFMMARPGLSNESRDEIWDRLTSSPL